MQNAARTSDVWSFPINSSLSPVNLFAEKKALAGYQALFGASLLAGSLLTPILAKVPGRTQVGFHHYFGGLPRPEHGPLIWVHGVSLGESLAACAIMEKIRLLWPKSSIGFTTTHPQVLQTIQKKRLADVTGFFPLDFLPTMNRAFQRWAPALVILVETDFWPGFAWLCRARGIPLVLLNGRISEKLHLFYSGWSSLGKCLLKSFAGFGVQTGIDRQRLIGMGAEPEKIKVLGNVKFDLVPALKQDGLEEWKAWLSGDSLAVFGSLHPSEFALLKPVFQKLGAESTVKILIAPRDIANASRWRNELREWGIDSFLRSEFQNKTGSARVCLLNTLGELARLYSLGTAAFIGGSLDPLIGGHNPIEALHWDVPVLMGPHVRNFADLVEELQLVQGVRLVRNAEEVEKQLRILFTDPMAHRSMVQAGRDVLERGKGALDRSIDFLKGISIGESFTF